MHLALAALALAAAVPAAAAPDQAALARRALADAILPGFQRFSGTANLACAAAGADLYDHVRESLWTAVPSLAIALFVFWSLGAPLAFDPSTATARIEAVADPRLLHFLPLALVLLMAALHWPPFAAIFLGALAGAALAILDTPDRVAAFAGPAPTHDLALLKGVWSALADGFVSSPAAAWRACCRQSG